MFLFQLILISLTGIYIIYKDLKERIIPNEINFFLLISGIAFMIYSGHYASHIAGCLILGFGMLFLAVVTRGFGLGDVKYAFSSGMLLGLEISGYGLMFGIILGGVYSAVMLLLKKVKLKDHIAYGPFLVLGNLMALLII